MAALKPLRLAIFGLMALALASAPQAAAQKSDPNFVPPDVADASDIPYPINTVASGLVTVAVQLDNAGQIIDVQTVRDIPSLTAPVLMAVQRWQFKSAVVNGTGAESALTINVLFNPGDLNLLSAKLAVSPILKAPPRIEGISAAEVTGASFAQYPVNSIATGAVVFDVEVSAGGTARTVKLVYGPAVLKATAMEALKRWRFAPAKLHRKPIASRTVVAFVFRTPTIATP